MVKNVRDNNIDFFRGIAALCIIFIHTVFWSGTSYTPSTMKSLSLLIDVPIFIFISGMSFNFSKSVLKTIKGFSKLWLKYIVFLMFYFILIFVFDNEQFSLNAIVKAIFFNYSRNDIFPAVASSLWFLYMYFVVSLLCDTIICVYNKYVKQLDEFKYVIIIAFLFYGISLYKSNFTFIGPNIFMYSFIYLLGYYLYNYKLKSWKVFVSLLIVLILTYIVFINYIGLDFNLMQTYKFDYDIRYLLHSMFSILAVVYFKDRLKIKSNNILVFIGKNALVFYFAQGISTSILYFILPYVAIDIWQLKLLIMYLINIGLTFTASLLVKFVVDKIPKIKINELLLEKKM